MALKYSTKLKLGVGISFALLICAPFNVFALESVKFAIKELCGHMEGHLGGLLMATAGVGGMISAAFGNMKAMYSFIITGIGAFTVSSVLSLYFPEAAKLCEQGNAGNPGGRTKSAQFQETNVSKIDEVTAINSFINNSSNQNESPQYEVYDQESDADLF